MRSTFIIFAYILIFFQVSHSLFAQNELPPQDNAPPSIEGSEVYIPKYEVGQAGINIGVGIITPLFFQKFTGEYTKTNLSVGGNAHINGHVFLWKALSLGLEIGGMFAVSPNGNVLLMAPLTAQLGYIFQVLPIEIPISLGMGMNITSLKRDFKIDFILKPRLGVMYKIDQSWSLGLLFSYWLPVQSYRFTLGNEFSRLGNFLDISIGLAYVL